MQDGNKFDPRSWVLNNLSLIDRAWEVHWALRLTQAVMFFDIAMRLTGAPGMVEWDSSLQSISGNIGFILITLAAFTLCMSIVVPFVVQMLQLLALIPIFEKVFAADYAPHRRWRCPSDWVTISDLERAGLERDDHTLIQMAQDHRAKREAARAEKYTTIATLTGIFLLTLVSSFPTIATIEGGTILDMLMHHTEYQLSSIVVVLVLFAILSTIFTAIINYDNPYFVHHPKLYRELRDKYQS